MRAAERVKRTARFQQNDLPRLMSIDYIDAIRKNISIGKYASTYAKYSQRYREWKYLIFKSTGGFWYLRGELFTSLKSFKGDKGRRMPIALYAYWLEYGRRGQPARPLFRPTLVEYSEQKALLRLEDSRQKLMGGWR